MYDYYYNTSWQVLEVRGGLVATAETVGETVGHQYVWDARYIDAPICRDADKSTPANGVCTDEADEHLFYCQDANFNVTALIDGSDGSVAERVTYDPYGRPTFLDASWANPSSTSAKNNRILYCGYRHDADNTEPGLYHVRFRNYHPTAGRWLQRDLIGYHQGTNLYQYARSVPTTAIDPLGLAACPTPQEMKSEFISGLAFNLQMPYTARQVRDKVLERVINSTSAAECIRHANTYASSLAKATELGLQIMIHNDEAARWELVAAEGKRQIIETSVYLVWSLPVYFAGHLAVKDAARLLADAERALSAYNASVPGLRGLQLLSVPKLLALGERVGGARVGLVYTQRAYQMIKAIYGVAIGGIVHTKLEGPMQEAADITGHLGALSEFFGAGNIGGILSAASQVEAVLALADRAESVMQDRADWNQVPRILRKIARRVQFRHACLLKWCKECKK